MSNLSELLPAGGAAKEFEPVASGTLPNGTAVVLKADGTVEAISESSAAIAQNIPVGSEVTFNSGETQFRDAETLTRRRHQICKQRYG